MGSQTAELEIYDRPLVIDPPRRGRVSMLNEDEARELISGNLCRCTGYQNIIKSVLRAAEIKREEGERA